MLLKLEELHSYTEKAQQKRQEKNTKETRENYVERTSKCLSHE